MNQYESIFPRLEPPSRLALSQCKGALSSLSLYPPFSSLGREMSLQLTSGSLVKGQAGCRQEAKFECKNIDWGSRGDVWRDLRGCIPSGHPTSGRRPTLGTVCLGLPWDFEGERNRVLTTSEPPPVYTNWLPPPKGVN